MATSPTRGTDLLPLYIIIILITGIWCYCFFLGTAAVRLWFYKGALGPEPQKFIVIRNEIDDDARGADQDDQSRPSDDGVRNRRRITFAGSEPPLGEQIAQGTALDPLSFLSTAPTVINIQDIGEGSFEFRDARIKAVIEEERRISRMPAFESDDCGDGELFPSISIATHPIEEAPKRSSSDTDANKLGLEILQRRDWLSIDRNYISYLQYHKMRATILRDQKQDCVYMHPHADAEAACQELLQEVAVFLVENYPQTFSIQKKHLKRHIRNEVTAEVFSLEKPFGIQPLEMCARLVTEDFCILRRDHFTRMWYLIAGAVLFPTGWTMPNHANKSLQEILTKYPDLPPLWLALPSILDLPTLNNPPSYTPSATPFTQTPLLARKEIFIQTSPQSHSLASLFHKPRPMDLFAGNIHNLAPPDLLVRREMQMLHQLPRCGAVVLTLRKRTERLVDVLADRDQREAFMRDVEGWGREEARIKGRDLWIGGVKRWIAGKPAFRDDVTIGS
ncbi:hypothetical protein DDE83_002081 [Stemphylium lycopersici]|uniref:Uncharacterized protein n=1 Tax=Stemphylium lycopersici TaxID=183478 RepID=A0A364NB11_STELY|nr:hypothetical protein DDE83_002081 [Stemphylium lycopersici]